jgi:hypothetical protein
MLRCAASLVIAVYAKVSLIPRDLRALPLDLFTRSSKNLHQLTFLRDNQLWEIFYQLI